MNSRKKAGIFVGGTLLAGALLYWIALPDWKVGERWIVFAAVGLALLAGGLYFLMIRRQERTGKVNPAGRIHLLCDQYGYLLKKLVSRDFRIKYQASLLGVLWSFLNPLLTMAVYLVVFSMIFHSDIENFPVYLLSGIVLFNYFADSTNLGLMSIVTNRSLITKVYMPKYVYPLSKVLSSALNLVISFIPLFIVMLVTGAAFHRSLLLLPVVVLFILCFCLGMSLILSTLDVFFRDTQFLWGILITVLNFLTPIFYPETIIPESYRFMLKLNPLYHFVGFIRSLTVQGTCPEPAAWGYCLLGALIPLAVGLIVFRKNQDKFVLYL